MKRFITVICIALMIVGIAGGSMANPASDALVAEGRGLLFNNGEPTYSGVIAANDKFIAANAADPNDQTAMLFLAASKLAVFGLENDETPGFQTLRDLYEAFGISRTDAESLLEPPISEPPTVFGEYAPPDTLPNGDEFQTFLAGPFLTLINEMIDYVDGVTDQAIMINLTAEELGDTTGIEVDYGDVLLLRSFLYTFKAFILLVDSYDMDELNIQEVAVLINADVMQLQRDIFDRYDDFLKLKSSNSLGASKVALLTAIDTGREAYNFISTEGDDQTDDLFAFGSQEAQEEAEGVLSMMDAFKTSLTDNVPMEIDQPREIEWVLTNGSNDKLGIYVEIDEDGNVSGNAWGIDDCDFLFCGGGVNQYVVEGDQITIQLETYQSCGDHQEILTATLIGTLNEAHDQVISGTYSKPGCFDESTGPFNFTGDLIKDETEVVKMDFNRIFGNTDKPAVNIHDVMPEFDIYDEAIPGTFPEPVLGGFFPDMVTNLDATMFFELQQTGSFTIPTRTITIDGIMGDWSSNELLHTDIEGDNDTDITGTDIEEVYLAKDDTGTYLYIGMTLYDGGPNQAVVYELGFRNSADNEYMPLKLFAEYDPDSSQWIAGVNYWDNDVFTAVDSVSEGTNCIEWKIPLSEIITNDRLNNNSLSGKFVSTGTLLAENENYLDLNQTRIQLDPATLTGNFSCPYDGTGNIFIKVMGESNPNSNWDLRSTWVAGSTDGIYTISGLPAGQDVYVYAFWDKDDNGVITYPDYGWGTADDSPMTFEVGTNSLNINITDTIIDIVGPFEVTGSVMSVHQPDDSIQTYYSVDVGNFVLGYLPEDVNDVTVKDPDGNIILRTDNFEFDGQFDEYFAAVDGAPKLGTYEFSVTAGGLTITATDTQAENRVIPLPDTNSFVPAAGTVVDSMTPVFSWDAVDFEDAFYRFEIIDQWGNRVYATSRMPGMLSAVVPQWKLNPGQTYYWRVRVTDSDNWADIQNRANSAWVEFTMADTLSHDATPALDLDSYGVVTFSNENGILGLDFWVKVIDHDGVAFNSQTGQASHTVVITFPDSSFEPMDFNYSKNLTSGYYSYWYSLNPTQLAALQASSKTFIFTVTDPAGNQGEASDVLTVNPLDALDEGAFSITPNGTTPTFTWDNDVEGANTYRVRIYTDDLSRTVWSGVVGDVGTYTVPPGVLEPNTTYRYRIDARDSHFNLDIDNVSRAPASNSENIQFTTGNETEAPFIDFDNSGVDTWNSAVTGPFLSFWINVHDAQGIPENIKSVKVQFPDNSEQDLFYDYNESSTCGIYRADFFPAGDEIKNGDYTFVAEDMDGNIFSLAETPEFDPIGFPVVDSLVQSSDGGGVHFTWDSVNGAAFYRVEIFNQNYNRLYALATETNAYHLPPGYLEDGKLYSWRVTTRREFFDENVDNGSSSPYFSSDRQNFIVNPDTGGSASPEIDTDGWGVYLLQANDSSTGVNGYYLAFKAKVSDADGVPGNIKEVKVTYPDESTTRTLVFDSTISSTEANYYKDEIISSLDDVQAGTYTFSVTDFGDNTSGAVSDTLDIAPISIAQNCLPAQGSVLDISQPEIRWDLVPYAHSYKVKLLTGFTKTIHNSNFITESAYTVPDDILNAGTGYSYQIFACREDPSVDVDNASVTNFFWSQNLRFTAVMFGDVNANGEVDLGDVILSLQSVAGINLNDINPWADVDGNGKTGLAEAVYGLQKEAEVR